jgi:2,4-dienoyl-CoA reductase-like NADH-dependent reductase (Old Yellow Enzyme family)
MLIERVHEAVGDDFIVGIRITGDDFVEGGLINEISARSRGGSASMA